MPKPFHKSILPIIKNANPLDLSVIGDIIIATKIPEGHDEIIFAWRQKTGRRDDSERVVASILSQKLELVS